MATDENRVISHIRAQMNSAHWLLEETISDVSDEMARFAPRGRPFPSEPPTFTTSRGRTGSFTPCSKEPPR